MKTLISKDDSDSAELRLFDAEPDDGGRGESVEDDRLRGHAADDIKAAVLNVFKDFLERSRPIMSEPHARWDRYSRLYSGDCAYDITTDSPILNQIYVPKLGELIRYSNASELQQMVPDTQTMDFVSVDPVWPGLDEDAEKSQALLRHKLRIMRTPDAGSLFMSLKNIKQDRKVMGNAVGIVNYDSFSGDLDGDPLSEGPIIERIDPRNWFPASLTVDSAQRCAHIFYAPFSVDEMERVPYADMADMKDSGVEPRPIWHSEQSAWNSGLSELASSDVAQGLGDMGYPVYRYLGALPWREIAHNLDEDEWTRDDVIDVLDVVFDLDPARLGQQWWHGEWVDDYLMVLQPFPLDLPEGVGPVWHVVYDKINSQLLGRGAYDTMEWVERIYNELHRYLLLLSALAARPPVLGNIDLLDPDWVAEHAAKTTFVEPGEFIWMRSGLEKLGTNFDPFKFMEMRISSSMAQIEKQMERLELLMRANVQTSLAYTGQAESRTATESQNNLGQSRVMEQDSIRQAECGWLLDLVARCYVVMRQIINLRGESFDVPTGADEQFLKIHRVSPESIRSLSYFMISVNGSSSPINKTNQTELILRLYDMVSRPDTLAALDADLQWFVKTALDMAGVRGKEKAFHRRGDVMAMLANITAVMGASGVDALPQGVKEQIMQIVAAGAQGLGTGQPLAGGKDNGPMTPEQRPRLGGNGDMAGVAPLHPARPPAQISFSPTQQ